MVLRCVLVNLFLSNKSLILVNEIMTDKFFLFGDDVAIAFFDFDVENVVQGHFFQGVFLFYEQIIIADDGVLVFAEKDIGLFIEFFDSHFQGIQNFQFVEGFHQETERLGEFGPFEYLTVLRTGQEHEWF